MNGVDSARRARDDDDDDDDDARGVLGAAREVGDAAREVGDARARRERRESVDDGTETEGRLPRRRHE